MSADLGVGDRPLPLDGVVVLDLGQIYQGPYAGFLMAMAGARVIKIEPPGGEPMRVRGSSLAGALLNSGKEAITLDLKQAAGLDLFRRLVEVGDVVLMNYAPGVPERLGIDYGSLAAINERLIYAHASGFGVRELDGSLVEDAMPAMDITVQAATGAFVQDDDNRTILHATSFLVTPDGLVSDALYSTGPIGRMTPADVLRKVAFVNRMG